MSGHDDDDDEEEEEDDDDDDAGGDDDDDDDMMITHMLHIKKTCIKPLLKIFSECRSLTLWEN